MIEGPVCPESEEDDMEIQINAKPLCTIADEFLPDVYQLLGSIHLLFIWIKTSKS